MNNGDKSGAVNTHAPIDRRARVLRKSFFKVIKTRHNSQNKAIESSQPTTIVYKILPSLIPQNKEVKQ